MNDYERLKAIIIDEIMDKLEKLQSRKTRIAWLRTEIASNLVSGNYLRVAALGQVLYFQNKLEECER